MFNKPRSQITFLYRHNSPTGPNSKCSHTTDAQTLGEIVEQFEYFLKGIGYSFEGHTLDFVSTSTDDIDEQQPHGV